MGAGPAARKDEGECTMSEKKAKEERNLKLMTEEAGINETAKKQAKDIAKMYEDRDKKAVGAKEHLISQLEVTADKYRTANGVMNALGVVRDVFGDGYMGPDEEVAIAKTASKEMAATAIRMSEKAAELDPEEMDQLCDGFYEEDFVNSRSTAITLVSELLLLQLCQNVGPNAEDISEFCKTADQEIEKAREDLKKFCEENQLDFDGLCGEQQE